MRRLYLKTRRYSVVRFFVSGGDEGGRSKQRLRNSEATSHTVLLKSHYRGR